MARRTKERKIIDTLGEDRVPQPSGREGPVGKGVPKRRRQGQKGRKIVGPRKEEHKYVVPWAIVE